MDQAAGRRLIRRRRSDRVLQLVLALVVGASGMWVALSAWGRSTHQVGPFQLVLSSRPGASLSEIALPPLGRIRAESHLAPLHLVAMLQSIDPDRAAAAIERGGLDALAAAVRVHGPDAVTSHAARAVTIALLGAAGAALLVYRNRWRAVARVTGAGAVLVVLLAGGTYLSFRPDAFMEASYTGSLSTARDLLGPVEEAGERFQGFRAELDRLVGATVGAYGLVSQEPPAADAVTVLHISDVHSSPLGMDFAQQLASEFDADLVVDTGDITTFGTAPERLILDRIESFEVPYVFIRGNHDPYSVGSRVESLDNAQTLENEAVTVAGIAFFGAPHPLYTPGGEIEEHDEVEAQVLQAGERLAAGLGEQDTPVDVLLVHDGRMAEPAAGEVPLVLSGHFHRFAEDVQEGTLFLENGSTGGGGLDVFRSENPEPLAAEILYLVGTPPRVEAFDRVILQPQTRELVIQRHLVKEEELGDEPVPAPTSPAGAD